MIGVAVPPERLIPVEMATAWRTGRARVVHWLPVAAVAGELD